MDHMDDVKDIRSKEEIPSNRKIIWGEVRAILEEHFDSPATRYPHHVWNKIRFLAGSKTFEELRALEQRDRWVDVTVCNFGEVPIGDWKPGQTLEGVRKQTMLSCLAYHNGHRGQTAKALGISYRTMTSTITKLREQGLEVEDGMTPDRIRDMRRNKLAHAPTHEVNNG